VIAIIQNYQEGKNILRKAAISGVRRAADIEFA
jgi:hypothetical protein